MDREREATRPMRRDAVTSRARLVEAARGVFAERGCEVPLADVAAAAGVGVATLSRHFDRTQLVEAVIEQRLVEHVSVIEESLAAPGENGVLSYVHGLGERGLVDRSLTRTMTLDLPDSEAIARLRAKLRQRQVELIAAGQRAGTLRDGVVPEDLVLILMTVQGMIERSNASSPGERVLAILVAGLNPAASDVPLPTPPEAEDLLEILSPPSRGRRPSPIASNSRTTAR